MLDSNTSLSGCDPSGVQNEVVQVMQQKTLSIDGFPGVATSEPMKEELVCEGRKVAGFGTSEKETSCSGFRVARAERMGAEV